MQTLSLGAGWEHFRFSNNPELARDRSKPNYSSVL